MKVISYILIGIITYLIQAQVFPLLFHNNWQPDLVLVWIVLLSLIKGRKTGLIVAGIGGIVRDVMIGDFFGLHLFPYLFVAYVAPALGSEIYEEQWYRSFFAALIATLMDGIMRYIMLFVIGYQSNIFIYGLHFIWPCLWMNGLLALAVHHIIWQLKEEDDYFWQ